MYKFLNATNIERLSDGACIPTDPDNKDFQEVLKWIDDGNEIALRFSVEDRRLKIWDDIQLIRESVQKGGVKVGEYWFHTDPDSRTQYLAMDRLGEELPENLFWKTMSGEFILMTPSLVHTVFIASVIKDIEVFAYAESVKALVYASEEPESVNIVEGWPSKYKKAV